MCDVIKNFSLPGGDSHMFNPLGFEPSRTLSNISKDLSSYYLPQHFSRKNRIRTDSRPTYASFLLTCRAFNAKIAVATVFDTVARSVSSPWLYQSRAHNPPYFRAFTDRN